MSEEIYRKLAKVLDSLPNGFPSTPDGVEIKLLKKVFTPDEADLFCDLKLSFEAAPQIAQRTGRPLDGLEEKLTSMAKRGEVMGISFAGMKVFAMQPWAVGIWEFQVNRMDREFCELSEQYHLYFGRDLLGRQPTVMRTVPIQEEIPGSHHSAPYQQVSAILESGKSFRVNECHCKKELGLLGSPCKKPHEVCLAISPVAGAEFILDWGREITKEQAYQVLRESEEAGLVHLTSNVKSGHSFICNCCGCCCAVLRSINVHNMTGIVNADFFAEIEMDNCDWCGKCVADRCQVNAIEEGDSGYRVIKERCIGCGLCVSVCARDAIRLVAKAPQEILAPPADPDAWKEARAQVRSVDYSAYK
ncbi:MAG TPA: 4Fe-4S binding protein [Candidatus Binataceae bacterium]|nr:4Fe-4S binding protein [Candidatus Binataceae bacterium]